MSDTPRTDAVAWVETNQENALVLASFARTLEIENADLRRQLGEAHDALRSCMNGCEVIANQFNSVGIEAASYTAAVRQARKILMGEFHP